MTKEPDLGTFRAMTTRRPDLNEYRLAIKALKKALKARGLTYRELGDGIGLSESGVKKIFAAQDGSFQRLVEICRFIGISHLEILNDGQVIDVSFSKEQQKFFLDDPKLFYFYWQLVYERRSLVEARLSLQLTDKESHRLVRKLDALNLLKLLPGDRIRIPSIKAVRWAGDGEFVQKIYHKWARVLIDSLAKSRQKEGEFFLLRYLKMKPNTYLEFIAALKSLEDEFSRRSIHEMRTEANKVEHVRWLVASDNRSFIEALQTLE